MKRAGNDLIKTVVALAGSLVLLSAGCDQAPADNEWAETSEASVTISWGNTFSDAQTTRITPAQADWLKSARLRARERLLAGLPAVLERPPLAEARGGLQPVSSALTFGSATWSDCQNLNWLLLTSAINGGGRFFCAKFSSTSGFPVIFIGGGASFVPKWFDAATGAPGVLFNVCHGSTGNCRLTQCCENGSCSGVWRSFFQNSGTGNISPPADVNVIGAQNGVIAC